MIDTLHYDAPIGRLLLAEQEGALTGLWIEGQKYFPASLQKDMTENVENETLSRAREWLDRYFSGEKPRITELKLAPEGSIFRREVWEMLCEIPYGQVTTYGALARALAAKRGESGSWAQAVGGAVGHNPISIIIPCHRVVGADGGLTGYAGGVERKRWLLSHEGVDMEGLHSGPAAPGGVFCL